MSPRRIGRCRSILVVALTFTTSGICSHPLIAQERDRNGLRPTAMTKELVLELRQDLLRRLSGKNINAHRDLNDKDKTAILKLSIMLIDETSEIHRGKAAGLLAAFGHVYCLPALCAVICNSRDDRSLRIDCAFALTELLDKRAVYHLIEDVFGVLARDEPDIVVDIHNFMIQMITSGHPECYFKEAPPVRNRPVETWEKFAPRRREWELRRARFYHSEWKKWWKVNADRKMTFDRTGRWVN
ncbi:MAG: hypothetical protein ACI8P0_000447 [Planctomycetaceae bacterium]|jgi:hypothetical protein